MPIGARVESIDAIKAFRAALIKFAESGNVALTAAESDIERVMAWLERDQTVYWAGQVRERHEEVMHCEDAVRQKTLFKNFDGTQQSAVDEMKAVTVAKRRREEAEQKCILVKKAIQVLRKESQLYKGRTQKLATTLQGEIPAAIRQIDVMLSQLDVYLSLQTAGVGLAMGEAAETIAKAASGHRVGIEKLRDRTPTAEQRRNAPIRSLTPDDPIFQPWGAGVMQDWQREALAKLTIERQEVDPEKKIMVARNAWQEPRVYLERMEPAFEADSGWFIGAGGAAESGKIEYDMIRAGDVVAARPDLAALLALPGGFLILLDSGGPAAMLDGAGLDVWAVALIANLPPMPAPEEPQAEEAAQAASGDKTPPSGN